MFEGLLDDTFAALSERTVRPVALPDHIGTVDQAFKGGRLRLENRFASIDDRYDIRSLYLSSAKVEVFTAFLFPKPDKYLPTYGMEVVLLGKRPIVGVLDAVELYRLEPTAPRCLAELRDRAGYVDRGDERPEWFEECRSREDVFFRPESIEDLLTLVPLHLRLVGSLTEMPAQQSLVPQERLRAVAGSLALSAPPQSESILDVVEHNRGGAGIQSASPR